MSLRVVVLISGSGSNLQAILDACADGRIEGEVVAVVSNRRAAYGLTRAEQAGVPTEYLPLARFTRQGQGREDYDAAVAELVLGYAPDLVVLAGWMHVLSPAFLDRLPAGRVINLHPALPGQFAGTHAIERAFEAYRAGALEHTGIMVHEVIPEVDAGPVLGTALVPIHADDDLEALTARVHAAEHALLVQVIAERARQHAD
ncbi:MAG: phosphoribosylglycinamide formyltransferase [Alphaproteobacteria bacterium]|nr:phosphoribosylglycinamide formyltransferase [Alphaproteobacteria bacterium]